MAFLDSFTFGQVGVNMQNPINIQHGKHNPQKKSGSLSSSSMACVSGSNFTCWFFNTWFPSARLAELQAWDWSFSAMDAEKQRPTRNSTRAHWWSLLNVKSSIYIYIRRLRPALTHIFLEGACQHTCRSYESIRGNIIRNIARFFFQFSSSERMQGSQKIALSHYWPLQLYMLIHVNCTGNNPSRRQ